MKIFKKIMIYAIIIIAISISFSEYTQALSTNSWYIYKGDSTWYSFSIKFPTDWHAMTIGDRKQGFSPSAVYDEMYFELQEFEGQTYEQVINYLVDENTEFVEYSDFIFTAANSDFLAKKVTYKNLTTNTNFSVTLIKRGSLILSLSNPKNDKNKDILQAIHDSFSFDTDWNQYINFNEKYTFTYPAKFRVEKVDNKINIYDKLSSTPFFTIVKYASATNLQALDFISGINDRLEKKEDIFFHGISNVISASYMNVATGKRHGYLFIEQNKNSYVVTNTNLQANYPHDDYFDQYIVEILEGLEFYDIQGDYTSYINFPDVREDHLNATSIDYLTAKGVIAGYPDGTFKPDGEINRAELTKMVVETVTNVDKNKFNNCFPDVKDEWYAGYICYAKDKGWVQGYPDGNFKPSNNVNRAESMKIILEVMVGSAKISLTDSLKDTAVNDIASDEWFYKYFVYANNRDLLDKQHIDGDINSDYAFKAGGNITRKEVAEMIYRIENL